MKKFLIFNIFLLIILFFSVSEVKASDVNQGVKGKILLQVESKGEAWYVDLVSGKKISLGRPSDALNVFRNFGIGITNDNLNKIPVASLNLNVGTDSDNDGLSDSVESSLGTSIDKSDTDGDGFSDRTEILQGYNPLNKSKNKIVDNSFSSKQTGKILLQVEKNGEAWYINPNDNKRYYLGNPSGALNVMKSLGLGISNDNLKKIETYGSSYSSNSKSNSNSSNSNNSSNSKFNISSIKISNGGDKGYIDVKDSIAITFSEAIDPESINENLKKGSYVSDVDYNKTGGVNVSLDGYMVIKGILTFDIGDVESLGTFKTKIALNSKGTVLTITLIEGNDIKILKEKYSLTTQLGGILKNISGDKIKGDADITNPTGTFGGVVGGGPNISSLRVYNGGDKGYIDVNDRIVITFSEAINPSSINADLKKESSVSGISDSKTGGVSISSSGIVTIKNIATFDMGSVDGSNKFVVKLALDVNSKILTITLASGSDLKITTESFASVNQLNGGIKDMDGNGMDKKSAVCNSNGTFGGKSTTNDVLEEGSPYISSIKVYNSGDDGYIDIDDYIKITFSEAIDPFSINSGLSEDGEVKNVLYNNTGGFSINSDGLITIKGISEFDMGTVKNSGNYTVKLRLNASGNVLTITLTGGSDIKISKESFGSASQIADFVSDNEGISMGSKSTIVTPEGTFGGVIK